MSTTSFSPEYIEGLRAENVRLRQALSLALEWLDENTPPDDIAAMRAALTPHS